MTKKTLITSALPYINGIKHLGNLIGSMLPADVYARFLRQRGEEVLYICGTDEHGTPAEIAANKAGQSVEDYCQQMHQVQKDIYARFNISFDYFGRSSADSNKQFTQAVFEALDRNGYIVEKELRQIYSNTDQRFLPDRYVEGTCPKCGYEKARGDQCDGCGSLLTPTDLIEPYSAISGSKDVEQKTSKHLFLKLDALQDKVATWVDAHPDWPQVTRGIALKWLKEGLQERCISRDLSWGVPIPKPGYDGKVFYVWFDAPNGYVAMTQDWAKAQGDANLWQNWWQNDDVNYVQFMAKDNVPFHAIFWPAMLMGADLNIHQVDFIKGFSWLNYDGGKFSTSQGRGVFTDQALELFPADYWRYYLLANTPEAQDADFSFVDFANCINKDLADVLGNFVNRVLALVNKYFDGKVPENTETNNDLVAQSQRIIAAFNERLSKLQFRQALQSLRELWVSGNEYITQQEPWKLAKTDLNQAAHVLNQCLHLLKLFALASAAVVPDLAQKLWHILNLPGDATTTPIAEGLDFSALEAGHALNIERNLISKIDDEQVVALMARFSGEDKI